MTNGDGLLIHFNSVSSRSQQLGAGTRGGQELATGTLGNGNGNPGPTALLAEGYANKALYRGDSNRGPGEGYHLRADTELLPSGLSGADTHQVLRNDGKRTAAPGMIPSSAAISLGTDAPPLVECGMDRVVNHSAVPLAATLHGIFALAHLEESLHDVLLHVRAGMFLGVQQARNLGILVGLGYAANDGQGLGTVVGIALEAGMTISRTVPTGIVSLLNPLHRATIRGSLDG